MENATEQCRTERAAAAALTGWVRSGVGQRL